MATRRFDFISGIESSTAPTASNPVNPSDPTTLGFSDGRYVQGGPAVADVAALKALDVSDRQDKDAILVESLSSFYSYDAGGSGTNDDDFIIQPTAGSGRWFKVTDFDLEKTLTFTELGSSPSTPSSGFRGIYATGSGFSQIDSAGVITGLGGGGGGSEVVFSTGSDYTVLDDDDYTTILVTTGGTDKTITLPTASANSNRILKIKKVDSGAGEVIIDGEGAETIDGVATKVLRDQYESTSIQCNSTSWFVVSDATLVKQTKWQEKTLGANVTSDGDILEFTGLTVGNTYEYTGTLYFQADGDSDAGGILIDIVTGATTRKRLVVSPTATGGADDPQNIPVSFSLVFVAADTNVKLTLGSMGATSTIIASASTFNTTWARLKQLGDHVITSEW